MWLSTSLASFFISTHYTDKTKELNKGIKSHRGQGHPLHPHVGVNLTVCLVFAVTQLSSLSCASKLSLSNKTIPSPTPGTTGGANWAAAAKARLSRGLFHHGSKSNRLASLSRIAEAALSAVWEWTPYWDSSLSLQRVSFWPQLVYSIRNVLFWEVITISLHVCLSDRTSGFCSPVNTPMTVCYSLQQ